jgi:hypothetical protein
MYKMSDAFMSVLQDFTPEFNRGSSSLLFTVLHAPRFSCKMGSEVR